jgi:hypothetical protein
VIKDGKLVSPVLTVQKLNALLLAVLVKLAAVVVTLPTLPVGDMPSASLAVAWQCDRIAIDELLTCD